MLANSPEIQVMPSCFSEKLHIGSVMTLYRLWNWKKTQIYSQLTFIGCHSLLFKGRVCFLVRAAFIVNPFVLPGKPSGQVRRWETGSQHSWREDRGGWEILQTWPSHARGVQGKVWAQRQMKKKKKRTRRKSRVNTRTLRPSPLKSCKVQHPAPLSHPK